MARDSARQSERPRSPSLPPQVVRRSTRSRSRSQTPVPDISKPVTHRVKLESGAISIPPVSPSAGMSQPNDSDMDSDASSTVVGAPKNRKKKRKREQLVSSDAEGEHELVVRSGALSRGHGDSSADVGRSRETSVTKPTSTPSIVTKTSPSAPGGSIHLTPPVARPKIKLINGSNRAISPLATVSSSSTPRHKANSHSPCPTQDPSLLATAVNPTSITSSSSSSFLHPNPSNLPGSNINFSLPSVTASNGSAVRTLVPPKPEIQKPMTPLPTTQSEVNEDFTQAKPGTQLLFATFWQTAEGYVRPIGEEDLAFLKTYKEEDKTPFDVPALGRHYSEIWEEEDRLIELGLPLPDPSSTGGMINSPAKIKTEDIHSRQDQSMMDPNGSRTPNDANGATGLITSQGGPNGVNRSLDYPRMGRKTFHYNPRRDMKDEDLVHQDRGEGPLMERVLGGFLRVPRAPSGGQRGVMFEENQMDEDDTPDRRTDDRTKSEVDQPSEDVGLGSLEDRVKKELMFVGLLGKQEVDWSQREDDEITTSLRQCQKLLKEQVSLNEARRSILLEIAKERLAYSEYQQCLDGLDRIIDTCWAKRAKQIAKQQKRKKEAHTAAGGTGPSGGSASGGGTGGGNSAGPGTSTMTKTKERERERDEREKEATKKLVETIKLAMGRRRLMVTHLGTMFKDEEEEEPGRFIGLPVRSVYEGLEDEFRQVGLDHLVENGAKPRRVI
ncbi:Histone acetyltransferases PCAF/SAGA/ADA, subunit TADA3L/NGG1 [Phaffia rhodozyma]|uniref:Histone acetyltransferases PCAF/SAGA/ADA, subunit TADA3L/NGG1 n=1 Tax=Phaffia rhodozyma TaxID=264483 RepID=A0A0F7SGZ4_PHARH|nr:Histone acetyltransferases PCAF/SAGA/ADA, subunit TADA3L/NGG1 [Phaffia rhodozyma]